jgi:hypothetical protein
MANFGQQLRIAQKIERNLKQILTVADGLAVNRSVNAAGDHLIEVTDGTWATTKAYILVKVQEMPLSTFPAQGFPVHKLLVCVEGDATARASLVDACFLGEVLARCKDMGCAIEIYLSAITVQPADQATAGGTFNAGAATSKRHIRASVDALGLGQ